ncbi:MAG: ATP-binding protein [Pelagimonas sp.]|uniref:ATP-binding protein n=1 Tax=Pelagimonas sp. TaxID=2073170 RepID=UPI003D6B7F68
MPDNPGSLKGDDLREDLRGHFDPLFRVIAIVAAVGLLVNTYRIAIDGIMLHTGVQMVMISILAIMLVFQKRLPIRVASAIVLVFLFLGCLAGLMVLGIGAAALMVFFVIPMFIVVLSTYKHAVIALSLITATILIVGYLHVAGIIQTDQLIIDRNSDMTNWIIAAIVFAQTAYLAVYLTHRLRCYWVETYSQLKGRHEEVNALIEHSPGAILIYDFDEKRFIDANSPAANLFGYSVEQLCNNMTVSDLFCNPPAGDQKSDTDTSLHMHVLAAVTGDHQVLETDLKPAFGHTIPCELSLNQLPLGERRLVLFTTVDIRHRKTAEQERQLLEAQLAQSQRLEAVGKLSGGVAHDFNNLLAVILGNVELLRDGIDDPDQLEMIETISDSVQRGSDLTQNMLSFARRARLTPQVLDLNDTVRDIKNWAGRTLPANVDVEVSLLAGLWPVEVDPSALQNALLNLLINARDAMPEGGKLTIETANLRIEDDDISERGEEVPPGRYTLLAISDTGAGIPKQILDRIFEPFFSTKPAGKGSGLGLSMVLGFMRQSGGTVRVYSEPGRGTTFKLYFRTSTTTEVLEKPRRFGQTKHIKSGHMVLVVEDEPELLILLVTTLSNAGYNVVSASSGDEAYEIFQRNPCFDLLLTDIVMPGKLQGT